MLLNGLCWIPVGTLTEQIFKIPTKVIFIILSEIFFRTDCKFMNNVHFAMISTTLCLRFTIGNGCYTHVCLYCFGFRKIRKKIY